MLQEKGVSHDAEAAARLCEQFDADGDGELNDEETNALREYLREGRGDTWVKAVHSK